MSCNDNEYYASLELIEAPKIRRPDGQFFDKAVKFQKEGTEFMTMILGMFAGYKAAIVLVDQGSDCEKPIRKALDCFPKVRFLLGIGVAYGMSKDVVKLCDVLVSSQIVDYGSRPRVEKGTIRARGDVTSTNPSLKNIFCKNTTGWRFECTKEGRQAKAVVSQLDSGSFLLDDRAVKEGMQEQFPETKGGEMEGWVLYGKIVGDRDILKKHPDLEAIIIKGVADYGDGTKNKRWQLTAAMAAASYTHFQLKRNPGMSTNLPLLLVDQETFAVKIILAHE